MRIAVTGIGAITALGNSAEESWLALREGRSGLRMCEIPGYEKEVVAPLADRDFSAWIPKNEQRRMDDFMSMGVVSCVQAWQDAGLEEFDSTRVGMVSGSGIGGLQTVHYGSLRINEGKRLSPFTIPSILINLVAGYVTRMYGIRGIGYAVSSSCAAGSHAIGESARQISAGIADVMIACSSEAAITPIGIEGFDSLRALASCNDDGPESSSRPFDKDRSGFVMGEGAGAVVLENWDYAKKRGAHIYAELVGYGASSDAHHITAPDPEGSGAELAMRMALNESGMSPKDIGFVSAHATSTPLGDAAEVKAMNRVFADLPTMVTANKSFIGHALGAAGSIAFVMAILAIRDGAVPFIKNLESLDMDSHLDFVMGEARTADLHSAMINAFAFGGANTSLIIKKPY